MRIGAYSDMDSWPHCKATIKARNPGHALWEFVFPVPIPEKLWEVRARWTVGRLYPRDVERDAEVTPCVVDGRVEKLVVRGKLPHPKELTLDINCPGEPLRPLQYQGTHRQACILDHITPDDLEVEEGLCWYCEEEVEEGLEECPACGSRLSREPPPLGELVERYGPDARIFVYFHDSDVSLNVAYDLDEEGLAKEKAEHQAKHEAEWVEYEELRVQWQDLAERVNAYNAAKTEAEERAKLKELKEKYDG